MEPDFEKVIRVRICHYYFFESNSNNLLSMLSLLIRGGQVGLVMAKNRLLTGPVKNNRRA